MTTDNQYRAMSRDLITELWHLWGRDKFNAWWQENVVALNGKIWWTYRDEYLILKEARDEMGLQELYDKIFRKEYEEETLRAKEWHEQMIDERP